MLMQPEERAWPRARRRVLSSPARHCGAATHHRALPQTLGGGEGESCPPLSVPPLDRSHLETPPRSCPRLPTAVMAGVGAAQQSHL